MSIIKIKELNHTAENVTFQITQSFRATDTEQPVVYQASYYKIASCNAPEFCDDILFVHGVDRTLDLESITCTLEEFDKIICSTAEYNKNKHNNFDILDPDYIECCGHLWLEANDCPCKQVACHICGESHPKDNMRLVTINNEDYYICKTHRKKEECPLCNTKHYFLIAHQDNSSIMCCESCINANIRLVDLKNYSYKPEPIFHHVINKEEVVVDGYSKQYRNAFWTGHEIEQQYKSGSVVPFLIGLMHDKQKDLIYVKSDSSVGQGFECVTHPFSWEFFKKHNWDGILNSQFKNHKGSGNSVGHHVHININAFSTSHLFRWLKFHNTHKNWVEYICERSLATYSTFVGGAITKALNKKCRQRYEYINIGKQTIEWRGFAAPTTIEQFKKNMEYLYASYEFSKIKNINDVDSMIAYIQKHCKKFPNLCKFIADNTVTEQVKRSNPEQQYTKFEREKKRAMGTVVPCHHCQSIGVQVQWYRRAEGENAILLCNDCRDNHCNVCDECDVVFYDPNDEFCFCYECANRD